MIQLFRVITVSLLMLGMTAGLAPAQTPPTASEIKRYVGLHAAAYEGNITALRSLIREGAALEETDGRGRTALHIAAYASHEDAVRVLAEAGANMNALEKQDYDIVTIAAVANDLPMLKAALELGASAGNITSPYEGTALIAAAHLGHHEVVGILIKAGAPLDHVNNLGWTALMEAVVLGDGGPDHVRCAKHLINAGADRTIPDRQGITPLEHAQRRGYAEMISALKEGRVD